MRFLALACLMFSIAAPLSALPNPFGPSPAQERAALAKYCGAEVPTDDQLKAIDLSVIEQAPDAAALASAYRKAIRTVEKYLDVLDGQGQTKRVELERHFTALYGREVHDELWQQTRPLRQAAYKKSVTEMQAIDDAYDSGSAKLLRLKNLAEALARIARDFVAINR